MQRFLLELLPALAAGALLGRFFPSLPSRLAPPLVHWGVPISLVGLLLRSGLRMELAMAALMGLLGPGLGLLVLRRLPPLRRLLPTPALQLGGMVGNTAYWGLPVALALLPAPAIAFTITYDLTATLFTWSVGPLLMKGKALTPSMVLRSLTTSPAGLGLAIALILQLTPWASAIGALLWWPARGLILLALALVGMRLAQMMGPHQPLATPGTAVAVAVKLLVSPALMLLLASLLRLPPLLREAVVLQAAAPTAISVLLLAELDQSDREAAAAVVFWSTLLALLSVPLWWRLLPA